MTREEAINVIKGARQYLTVGNPIWNVKKVDEAMNMAIEALSATNLKAKFESVDAVSRYAEWLEKIIVDNEGANEWLCEDTPDLEWCEKNCHYSSIQAECLRHLYEVCKGGARMEANE